MACHVISCFLLLICLCASGTLCKLSNPSSTESCVTANGRPGQCKTASQCLNVTASQGGIPANGPAARSSCLSSSARAPVRVCCPFDDESAVVFPGDETDDELVRIAPSQLASSSTPGPAEIDARHHHASFISPGSVEFILPKGLPRRCGEMAANPLLRIVGGTPAPKGSWPWLARLGYYNGNDTKYLCAGVLITKQHVLTAAHCVHKRTDLVFVRLGENGLSSSAPHEYYIEAVTVHERFVPSTRGPRNDIAIIRLSEFVVFSDDIKPICLPVEPSVRIDLLKTQPIVAGWGSTSYYGQQSDALLQVQLPVVPQTKCAQSYAAFDQLKIDQSVLCAGLESGGKDACRGDSGGPLIIYHRQRYYVMGLVSFGYRCGEAGYPGVYARVSYYIGWIFKNLN